MAYSLLDCYKMRENNDHLGIWRTYRKICDSFKGLIHLVVGKADKDVIQDQEAIAAVTILVAVIDYLERFHENGLNGAMQKWADSRLSEVKK